MRQRVETLAARRRVWISTFHSLGVRLLRQYADRLGLDRNFTIYDQADRVQLVKTALEVAGIDNVRFTPESIQAAISKAKNQLLLPDKFAPGPTIFSRQVVAAVYALYEKKLRDANALDFDDLLLWPALALKNDEELRAELDARFRYVLIDEYQDTNQAQYAIARGCRSISPNLCVVGDPDQSIYKWRGSDIRNILDFERDFPGARVITLGENYRSTQGDPRRRRRADRPQQAAQAEDALHGQPDGPAGASPALRDRPRRGRADRQAHRRRGGRGQARLPRLRHLPAHQRPVARPWKRRSSAQRVPFQIVRGLAFFDRKENSDVLAYLRLLVNPRDDLSFLRVVNEPARGIGKVSLEHLEQYAEPRETDPA